MFELKRNAHVTDVVTTGPETRLDLLTVLRVSKRVKFNSSGTVACTTHTQPENAQQVPEEVAGHTLRTITKNNDALARAISTSDADHRLRCDDIHHEISCRSTRGACDYHHRY